MPNLQDIEKTANDNGYIVFNVNSASRVASFRPSDSEDARVNVYYTTGTGNWIPLEASLNTLYY